jgi:hypothetical protein
MQKPFNAAQILCIYWSFGVLKGNFYSLKRKFLTVGKGKFWQFEKGNFDSLGKEILTVWKGKFW